MKKLFALLLALIMVFSLATVALADGEETGTINIGSAGAGFTYKIYKILDLYTYDNAAGAYTYKLEGDDWKGFFTGDGAAYVNIDANGYVSWATNADPVAFAKKALEYATTNDIEATDEKTPTANGTVTFDKLELGYYLVDTSMGALCGLTTTKPNASLAVKNGTPTLEKQVEEDSHVGTDTNAFGPNNSADIGQTVNFDVSINVQAGAQNYVYHDEMDNGLDFIEDSVKVKYHNPEVPNVTTTLEAGKDYTLKTGDDADVNCTFEVHFAEDFLNTTHANDKIYVTYSAIVNNLAITGAPGNQNDAWLTYGDKHETTKSTTETYTYGFDIFKTDAAMKPLTGAQFKLYASEADAQNGTNPIMIVRNLETGEYRRATRVIENKEEDCNFIITVNNPNGIARVNGLDNGTYYLVETKAPAGYTEMVGYKSFIISGSNMYAKITKNEEGTDIVDIGSSIHVENLAGATLPETGAMGTTMFIMFGMFVVLGTGVLLVTKKRMSMIED